MHTQFRSQASHFSEPGARGRSHPPPLPQLRHAHDNGIGLCSLLAFKSAVAQGRNGSLRAVAVGSTSGSFCAMHLTGELESDEESSSIRTWPLCDTKQRVIGDGGFEDASMRALVMVKSMTSDLIGLGTILARVEA